MSAIVEDIFSESLNLCMLCPNGVHRVHMNTEKYLPNPLYNSLAYLRMFEFVGKLMGMSLRAKLNLPFEFPALIWKKLAGIIYIIYSNRIKIISVDAFLGESTTLDDLAGFDFMTYTLLKSIRYDYL